MGIIQRQSIKNFFTSYIGVLIGFVNIIIIQPRFLSPEELGLTRVLYSFALFLSTFVPFGISNIAIRFFPEFKNPEKRHHGFFGFMLLGTIIGFIITASLLFLFRETIIARYAENSKLFTDFFYWVFPLILILTLITQLNIYCYSLYKSTVPAFLNDIMARIGVIVVVSLYFLKLFALKTFIILFITVYGLQALAILIYIFYEERPGFKIDFAVFTKSKLKIMFGYAAVVWLSSIASTGLKELGVILLGINLPLQLVAVYAIASFIPTLIEVPINALDKIATYKISAAWSANNFKEIETIYKKSARYMLLAGGLLFLLINGNIESLLKFLPDKYQNSNHIIFILSIGTLINMATGLNAQVLFYSKKYYYGAMLIVIAVIVNIVLQLTLVPLYGINGAAMATAVSGVFLNLMSSLFVWKHFNMHPLEKNTLKQILFIAAIATADYFIPHVINPYLDILLHGSFITLAFAWWTLKNNLIPEINSFIERRSR